jgi:hypothetical protein
MPIHKMHFEDGVFASKSVGYLDNVDARMWANALRTHADNSPFPITAVLDVLEVNRICPTVTQILTTALTNPNVRMVVLATGGSISAQKARVIDQLSQIPGLRVASELGDARHMAQRTPAYAKAGVGSYNVSSFALAY